MKVPKNPPKWIPVFASYCKNKAGAKADFSAVFEKYFEKFAKQTNALHEKEKAEKDAKKAKKAIDPQEQIEKTKKQVEKVLKKSKQQIQEAVGNDAEIMQQLNEGIAEVVGLPVIASANNEDYGSEEAAVGISEEVRERIVAAYELLRQEIDARGVGQDDPIVKVCDQLYELISDDVSTQQSDDDESIAEDNDDNDEQVKPEHQAISDNVDENDDDDDDDE